MWGFGWGVQAPVLPHSDSVYTDSPPYPHPTHSHLRVHTTARAFWKSGFPQQWVDTCVCAAPPHSQTLQPWGEGEREGRGRGMDQVESLPPPILGAPTLITTTVSDWKLSFPSCSFPSLALLTPDSSTMTILPDQLSSWHFFFVFFMCILSLTLLGFKQFFIYSSHKPFVGSLCCIYHFSFCDFTCHSYDGLPTVFFLIMKNVKYTEVERIK